MNTKIFNKFLTVFAVGSLALSSMTSCSDDILETKNLSTYTSDELFSNAISARKMIDNVYAYFCEDSYTSRMSTNWMQNNDVEIGFVNATQAVGSDRRAIWALNPSYFGDIKTCWENSQKAIDFANQCIEGIEKSDLFNKGDKDMKQLHGEAYCLRAYWYWLMCNFWADVPFATTPTTESNMHNDPRTDKNIIYSHCIQDLINVEEEMQWDDVMTVERMNREFALGFIVKLAMFRAGYSMQADGTMARSTGTGEEYTVTYKDENGNEATATAPDDYYKVAKAYALKLISLRDRELTPKFKTIFDNEINGCNPNRGDVIFEMGYTPNSGGDIGWCLGLSVTSSSKGSGTSYTMLTPSYACSFDPQDQRLPVTCQSYAWLYDNKQKATAAVGIQPAKWCRMDLNVNTVESKGTGINFPVLRWADVLLLLAEADNEINNGPTALAKQMLTRVRARAFNNADNYAQAVTEYVAELNSYDQFRQAIINERAWEFGGEMIRKFDLVRWNYYSDAIVNTIEWIRNVGMNLQQLKIENGEFIYDKNKAIEQMNIAPRLYYTYEKGEVKFINNYFTYVNPGESPYKEAETLTDDAINEAGAGATFNGLKYVKFMDYFFSVSDTDPTTKAKYGTYLDDNGNEVAIKKGVLAENIRSSWFGLTDGVLITGAEDLSGLRSKPTPYVIPIPTDKVNSSNGVLSNDGYGIRNK